MKLRLLSSQFRFRGGELAKYGALISKHYYKLVASRRSAVCHWLDRLNLARSVSKMINQRPRLTRYKKAAEVETGNRLRVRNHSFCSVSQNSNRLRSMQQKTKMRQFLRDAKHLRVDHAIWQIMAKHDLPNVFMTCQNIANYIWCHNLTSPKIAKSRAIPTGNTNWTQKFLRHAKMD